MASNTSSTMRRPQTASGKIMGENPTVALLSASVGNLLSSEFWSVNVSHQGKRFRSTSRCAVRMVSLECVSVRTLVFAYLNPERHDVRLRFWTLAAIEKLNRALALHTLDRVLCCIPNHELSPWSPWMLHPEKFYPEPLND